MNRHPEVQLHQTAGASPQAVNIPAHSTHHQQQQQTHSSRHPITHPQDAPSAKRPRRGSSAAGTPDSDTATPVAAAQAGTPAVGRISTESSNTACYVGYAIGATAKEQTYLGLLGAQGCAAYMYVAINAKNTDPSQLWL